jgi:AraC-like DNA-binding protein
MEITLNLITLTHLAAAFFGLLSAMVILYYGYKSNPANQPLGIAQLSISLAIWVSFSVVSQLILQWPFLYRLGQVFVLIFIPMTFLHVVFYTSKRSWKWYDLVHVIPLLIFLIDYRDVLLLPSTEKIALIKQEISDLDRWMQFSQSRYFSPGFHQAFRLVTLNVYWIAQVVVFVRWLRRHTSLSAEDKVWKNWILVFLGCQFFMWFPYYLNIFWLSQLTTYHIVNSFAIGWLMISSFSLFFFPSILYGPKLVVKTGDTAPVKVRTKAPITDAEQHKLAEAMHTLEAQMEANKYFLTPGYSIHDFSRDINLPAYQISKSLNTFKGMGFVDFINQKRIQYCIAKFNQGEWLHYRLEAVATECGFSNRNSFTKSFIKFHGATPSDYRDNLKVRE